MAAIQKVTALLGLIYLLVGILGFVPGIARQGMLLGIFAVNALHNLAHLVVGAVLLWGGMGGQVLMVNRVMAVVFALLTGASVLKPLAQAVAINEADTVLHAASALLTAYLGFLAIRGEAAA